MNTMVILVNERPESRAALDWTLKGQPATTAAGDTKLRVVLRPSTDIPGGPPLRLAVSGRRSHHPDTQQRNHAHDLCRVHRPGPPGDHIDR